MSFVYFLRMRIWAVYYLDIILNILSENFYNRNECTFLMEKQINMHPKILGRETIALLFTKAKQKITKNVLVKFFASGSKKKKKVPIIQNQTN